MRSTLLKLTAAGVRFEFGSQPARILPPFHSRPSSTAPPDYRPSEIKCSDIACMPSSLRLEQRMLSRPHKGDHPSRHNLLFTSTPFHPFCSRLFSSCPHCSSPPPHCSVASPKKSFKSVALATGNVQNQPNALFLDIVPLRSAHLYGLYSCRRL